MKYSFESKIRYSEIGIDGMLTLPSLINYFQDCSNFQSEELDIGLSWLMERKRAWVLAGWQILINRYPKMGEDVKVSTWASRFVAFQGYRNFTMECMDGEMLAAANSIWVYMDLEKQRPVRPPQEEIDAYGSEEALDLPFGSRKVHVPKENGKEQETIKVMEYNLDTNRHVNNGQYVSIAESYLPENFRSKELHIEYKIQAHLSDIMVPVVYKQDNAYTVALNTVEGRPYAVANFEAK